MYKIFTVFALALTLTISGMAQTKSAIVLFFSQDALASIAPYVVNADSAKPYFHVIVPHDQMWMGVVVRFDLQDRFGNKFTRTVYADRQAEENYGTSIILRVEPGVVAVHRPKVIPVYAGEEIPCR